MCKKRVSILTTEDSAPLRSRAIRRLVVVVAAAAAATQLIYFRIFVDP